MFGPRPLPAHFGKVDPNAPFDAKRYYTVLRCSGMNPTVRRDRIDNCTLGFELPLAPSTLQRKRIDLAHAWSNAKDSERAQTNAYLKDISKDLPIGKIHYLGC
jgi:hypothetical protein